MYTTLQCLSGALSLVCAVSLRNNTCKHRGSVNICMLDLAHGGAFYESFDVTWFIVPNSRVPMKAIKVVIDSKKTCKYLRHRQR